MRNYFAICYIKTRTVCIISICRLIPRVRIKHNLYSSEQLYNVIIPMDYKNGSPVGLKHKGT